MLFDPKLLMRMRIRRNFRRQGFVVQFFSLLRDVGVLNATRTAGGL